MKYRIVEYEDLHKKYYCERTGFLEEILGV